MNSLFCRSAFLLILMTFTLSASAQGTLTHGTLVSLEQQFPKILDLNWLNQNFLKDQRKTADDLVREHLGKRFKTVEYGENTLENIKILQRLVYQNKLKKDDTMALQSLGVILGDIYVDQHKALEWKTYEDELAKSHAVCVKDTEHCLFPITMLSRRIQGGLTPNVQKVYDKGYNFIRAELPKLPFSD